MRFTRTKTLLVGATLALVTAACGSDSGGSEPKVEEAPKFESGTTMAKLADAGKVTVGTKFDQPGFGLLGLDDTPHGFDVEVARSSPAPWESRPTTSPGGEHLRRAQQVIEDGDVDFVVATYTVDDERGRSPWPGRLRRRPPADGRVRQRHHRRPDDLRSTRTPRCARSPGRRRRSSQGVPRRCEEAGSSSSTSTTSAPTSAHRSVDVVTTDNVILLGRLQVR